MKNKNITLLVVLVIVLIILAGLAISWSSVQNFLQTGVQKEDASLAPEGDTTPEIQQALDQIDIRDLDVELQGIDTDLNSL